MKVLVVGGGTGGHVTPIRPVLSKLRQKHPEIETVMIGDTGNSFVIGMNDDQNLDRLFLIRAGKWRRYSDDSVLRKLFDFRTHFFNVRDLAFLAIGMLQSFRILRQERPDVIFLKGGYVGVPVGLVAARMKIPFITHDSDVLPGLANRINASRATYNAVGWPIEHYNYDADKIVSTGVPIRDSFTSVNKKDQTEAKKQLGLDPARKLVLVVGGSSGAQKLNQVLVAIAERLVEHADVVHIAGALHRDTVQKAVGGLHAQSKFKYQVIDFTDQLHVYTAAADLIVARAGATTFAEFAAMGKPAIYVPAPQLADQAKNVALLERAGFVVRREPELIASPETLLTTITSLLSDEKKRLKLHKLALSYARTDAAEVIAELLVKVAKKQQKSSR